MTLDLQDGPLADALARAHPHLRRLCAAAGERALVLHSEQVTLEHLLDACMRDEDCAAHALVVHAFADPPTISFELTALCPGVMVVGSAAALPFSPRALEAIEAARAAALAARADSVEAAVLLAAATAALPEQDRAALGLALEGCVPTAGGGGLEADGPLFRGFDPQAKSALSRANKAASARGETSIGPAQLVLACLEVEVGLAARAGVSASAARARLAGRTADPSAPTPRPLTATAELIELLAGLPQGGGTLELVAAAHARGSQELRVLFARHMLTPALLERAAGAFHDPDSS